MRNYVISESRNRWRAALRLFGAHLTTNAPAGPDIPSTGESESAFRRRPRLLNPCESELFETLSTVIGDVAVICPKTRVTDVLCVGDGVRHIDEAVRIDRKTIDFLICERKSFQPRLAIQVDWWDENQQRYQSRDHFVDRALVNAQLPLLHVRSNQIPSARQLRAKILPLLGGRPCVPAGPVARGFELPTGPQNEGLSRAPR